MGSKDDKLNTEVRKYNNDTCEALTNVLTGSLKRHRITLADIAGLAVNDNEEEGVTRHG